MWGRQNKGNLRRAGKQSLALWRLKCEPGGAGGSRWLRKEVLCSSPSWLFLMKTPAAGAGPSHGWAPDSVARLGLYQLLPLFQLHCSPLLPHLPLFPQRISKKEQAVLTSNSRQSPLSPTLTDVWSGRSKLWSPQGKRRGDDCKPSWAPLWAKSRQGWPRAWGSHPNPSYLRG